MTVDVQAERLRELRETADRRGIFTAGDGERSFALPSWDDVQWLLDMLAGQAEQIERLRHERDTFASALRSEPLVDRAVTAERQRDNLRDALRQAREDVGYVYLDGFDSSRRKKALDSVQRIDAALRAAAVGEEPRQRETAADADAAAYRDAARAVGEEAT